MSILTFTDNKLIRKFDGETIWIEPWGKNALRIRCTRLAKMPEENWALLPVNSSEVEVKVNGNSGFIRNGNVIAEINEYGFIKIKNSKGDVLLEEYWQTRIDKNNKISLQIPGRELKPIPGGLYKAKVVFKGCNDEKMYGLGQHQEPFLNLKGCEFELSQRNSQATVPFIISNRGYGFLWNNPAVGRVTFAKNGTQWVAEVTKTIDYWVTTGENIEEIIENYTEVTGRYPPIPYFATGFWQSKLRYHSQDEVLEVAREYKKRGLPLSVIVIDFFHWPQQGEWRFDPKYWPDPEKMVKELKDMGIEVMVSIWPTVDPRSCNYQEMKEKGYLVQTDRGIRTQMLCQGNEVFVDFTNPEAGEYVWNKVKENYFKYGIRIFWLDEAEPEYSVYDFDNYRYSLGPCLEVGNIYPFYYAKAFYEGLKKEGINDVLNLVRCAWAGSQRYGALVWSGDIHSNFKTLRKQVAAGLNMALSGIALWTTDIGGFFGGDPKDPKFQELIVRWFQYGVFCPVCRLHGYREPTAQDVGNNDTGMHDFDTCGPNEVWSFGDKAYEIIKELLFLRERLRPYIAEQFKLTHERGTPIMRPLFYDFPQDDITWEIEDEYMFGPDILVAPVLYEGATSRRVYLPAGVKWVDVNYGKIYEGGQWIDSYYAPLEVVPVFVRESAPVLDCFRR
ncbi:glycoside hydrolase family 31 [Caldicellulosiruptor hydrothermalis 108]|uniref:Glycoside hydrolase family 31 n=1 Tax=Caldicellulosiruptor hydrothermalis (strain DSM 18901 / VKM B-2411 / 108) TaxID=632292 RepID=E4QDM3_CALH1|nr:glycoside hydrolase family 31 protein [Caldicellulosiruptor hydrothermalis]ADQ06440.1 glycoside hydrolase family 31 [Caldicellulosiruptor hydrothermalis 108]